MEFHETAFERDLGAADDCRSDRCRLFRLGPARATRPDELSAGGYKRTVRVEGWTPVFRDN